MADAERGVVRQQVQEYEAVIQEKVRSRKLRPEVEGDSSGSEQTEMESERERALRHVASLDGRVDWPG